MSPKGMSAEKKEYYLDSGLRQTPVRKYATDKKAWEGLRKMFLPSKVFIVLYRYERIPVIDEKVFRKAWKASYSSAKESELPIPIYWGLTSSPWKVKTAGGS